MRAHQDHFANVYERRQHRLFLRPSRIKLEHNRCYTYLTSSGKSVTSIIVVLYKLIHLAPVCTLACLVPIAVRSLSDY